MISFLRPSLILLAASLCLSATALAETEMRIPKSNVEALGVKKTVETTAAPKATCESGGQTFCFQNNRFSVQVTWKDFSGTEGVGTVVDQPVSDNSGVFWFFTDGNWEMLVKVLDGCSFNDHFWVFSAATTDVEYTLTVTDTATGQVVTYTNPLGNAAAALTDVEALATCTP